MSSGPGTLASLLTADDISAWAYKTQAAAPGVKRVWLGSTDVLSPGTPYWSADGQALDYTGGDRLLDSWRLPVISATNTYVTSNATAGFCGYLDVDTATIRRAVCTDMNAFLCMSDAPLNSPVIVHRATVLSAGTPYQYSWVVGSACETGVSVSRSLVNSTTGELVDTTTISQLSMSLTCGNAYKPARTEINQDIVRDNLQIGYTYRFCVVVLGDIANKYSLNAADPLRTARFVSPPECRDVKIAWTAKISGQVATRLDTPAPGVRITARIVGSPFVFTAVTDEAGSYQLTLQAHVDSCDPDNAPELCLGQSVE
ncbi:hypothetical protein PLESTF_000765100 [Pleodorina starrii]|nr:hypothetical protein PLESTF_000765100 [Pleodorina starrii]